MKQLIKQLFTNKKHFIRLILPIVTVILSASLFTAPALATGVYQIPNLTSGNDTWVLDQGEVISRLNEGKISSALQDLAKQTGKEVRIVTIRHFDYGETAESFTKELFEKWFPTKEAQANQTLLVLDTATNNTAIITGDGVKSLLTDSITESVANETLSTPLRKGNKYNQAFIDASDRLVAILSGKPDPGPPQIAENVQVEGTFKDAEETKAVQGSATAWVIGLLIAATVIPMATYYIYQINQPSSDG
ncbi:beta-propeller domain-containing protein, methanol dehydrogenase [Nostoc linckia z18]|uniref:Beta-propeller domain-containing protein, methanol dehydrogenase n=2 Tax=Nostoc linckia TaxID=92942 RepID=A0A9Q5ZFJ5_NOSLI|nr:TPM domain-containing protein [Nostoc linckia]PHK41943.1 beta-propeller domain-containing protein, methanol dehydrogenase [Nostoc linckia z15]PHK46674.1 beta-propeller domain-containing protein, methanol dehydrogenase [Nostoc linckia z16]PHJ67515.1 beta-propeller domain-containing protein, methanol dehydrogenase [Nostoc linckia z1]PHJ72540.1 beta-propeller domain-containing protein, methanol dehydrogenase [Nostoc linckia z3]PHJ74882.1 beta-propeller domain-containing protein, methanol dehyd